jgi:hypothetical protein
MMTEQLYRATLTTAVGTSLYADVTASTGDEAATAALAQYPGARVSHIEPAPAHLQPHIIAAKAAEKKAA